MKEPSAAPAFACIYPILCEAARAKGYALALHGTMQRDLDFVAIPWTDEAVTAREVVDCITESVGGHLVTTPELCPGQKPHGRLAWTIHLEAGFAIDLSVMPRIEKQL